MYDHRRKADLIRLKSRLDNADTPARAAIAAFCLAGHLMRPRGFAMRTIFFAAWLADRRCRGFGPMKGVLARDGSKAILDQIWHQLLEWMVNGRDASDTTSAGGWNRVELNFFIEFVETTGIDLRSLDPASAG